MLKVCKLLCLYIVVFGSNNIFAQSEEPVVVSEAIPEPMPVVTFTSDDGYSFEVPLDGTRVALLNEANQAFVIYPPQPSLDNEPEEKAPESNENQV